MCLGFASLETRPGPTTTFCPPRLAVPWYIHVLRGLCEPRTSSILGGKSTRKQVQPPNLFDTGLTLRVSQFLLLLLRFCHDWALELNLWPQHPSEKTHACTPIKQPPPLIIIQPSFNTSYHCCMFHRMFASVPLATLTAVEVGICDCGHAVFCSLAKDSHGLCRAGFGGPVAHVPKAHLQ